MEFVEVFVYCFAIIMLMYLILIIYFGFDTFSDMKSRKNILLNRKCTIRSSNIVQQHTFSNVRNGIFFAILDVLNGERDT